MAFWAKLDPIWAKGDPPGQFVRKVGKSALELGEKKGGGINHIDLSIAANMELVEFLSTYLLRRPSSLLIMQAVS